MENKKEIIILSERHMKKFAKQFYKTLKGGEVILLNGDLGAGKTTFTKYLCKAAHIDGEVTSPTFTIMREYEGKELRVVHFDLYRIEDSLEVQEFGFEEYILDPKDNQIVLIEWPHNLKDFQYPNCIELNILKLGDQKRKIELTVRGK